MPWLDFFDVAGRVGSGEVSASADVIAADDVASAADAVVVASSELLPCAGLAFAEAVAADFCKLFPDLSEDFFVAVAASSVWALAEAA
jgi:hypothetical protein